MRARRSECKAVQVMLVPSRVCCKIQDPAPDLNYSCTYADSRCVTAACAQTGCLRAFCIVTGQNSLERAAQKDTEVVVLLLLNTT